MKTLSTRYLAALLMLLAVAGCAKSQNEKKIEIPKRAAKLEVSFSWAGIAPCTHESPEIRVSGIPSATTQFKVRLINLSQPTWNQGGGEAANDGSGVIPAGALTIGYNGPCPPPDKRQKYEFEVMAVDAAGTIVGFGKARESYPPK